MVKIETYNPYDIDLAFDLNEGNVTCKKVEVDFGTDMAAFFDDPFEKGDYVTLDTTRDKTVKKAASGDLVIGQIIDEPRWKGNRPTESADYLDYEPRVATVRLNCDYVHAVQLGDDNEEVAVGDYIEYAGDNLFAKTSTDNGNIALKSAKALSGDKIPVVYGLRPM